MLIFEGDVTMYVYMLTQKDESIPFYVGITSNPSQRLKQHKNSNQHDLFVNSTDDIVMRILFDTGDNEYSKVLAERIEVGMIQYFGTYPAGSNRCVDVSKMLNEYPPPPSPSPSVSNRKRNNKRWKKIVSFVSTNPFITGEELSDLMCLSETSINSFIRKTIGLTLNKYLQLYRDLWYEKNKEHIRIKIEW